jgi:hypothetical protein
MDYERKRTDDHEFLIFRSRRGKDQGNCPLFRTLKSNFLFNAPGDDTARSGCGNGEKSKILSTRYGLRCARLAARAVALVALAEVTTKRCRGPLGMTQRRTRTLANACSAEDVGGGAGLIRVGMGGHRWGGL